MKKFIVLACVVGAVFYFYSNRQTDTIVPVSDFSTAFSRASNENKYLFILFGRETCKNCQSLRSYIEDEKVVLPKERFVFADINCDDARNVRSFSERFSIDGRALPFVIVADSYGRQFASRSGYGSPEEFTKLIDDAVAHIERGY